MLKIVNINPTNSETLLRIAQSLLFNDKIIAIPTDTIYGLAVAANSAHAIKRLYDVKERHLAKPFAICVSNIADIYKYSEVTVEMSLLSELLPGAVTVMFQRNDNLNAHLNPDHNLVGIRVPDYSFVRELCHLTGPIALTSANISSQTSCLNIEEFRSLWPSVDAVFNGGQLGHIDPERLGSTIIDLSTKGYFRIVRDGCVLSHTLQILKKYKLTRLR